MKYTAIYVDSWQSGSHTHSITKYKRIEVNEGENVLDALVRNGIADRTVFLFEGWPKLQGEEERCPAYGNGEGALCEKHYKEDLSTHLGSHSDVPD